MKKQIMFFMLLILLLALFSFNGTAYYFFQTEDTWDMMCSYPIHLFMDLNHTPSQIIKSYSAQISASESLGYFYTVADYFTFASEIYLYNLSDTDNVQITCSKDGQAISMPNPFDYGHSNIRGTEGFTTINLNNSNFAFLANASVNGSLQLSNFKLYMFQQNVGLGTDEYNIGNFGQVVTCIYSINWLNETSCDDYSHGIVDKIKIATIVNPPVSRSSNSSGTPFYNQAYQVTGYIVSLVSLNWTIINVLYWFFLIGILIVGVGLIVGIPIYLYRLLTRIGKGG